MTILNKLKFVLVITIVFFAINKLSAQSTPPANNDPLRFEILMSSRMLNEIHLDVKFIESLEITSNNLIMLSSSNKFYLLGWGGIKPIGQKLADTVSSFAYTPDGYLMVVRNNELCYVDTTGNLAKVRNLPSRSLIIAEGKNSMYFFDRNKNKQKYPLYKLAKGGSKFDTLVLVPSPIASVAEVNKFILFSIDNALFYFNPKNKDLVALTALEKGKEIKSIAVDTINNIIYYSTAQSIYALKDSKFITVTEEIGGMLKCYMNGLLVFNPDKKSLIRITGLENILSLKLKEAKTNVYDKKLPEPLTNSTIINLVKEKLSDDKIINIINNYKVNFNMSTNSIIALTNQNVSSAVIEAMAKAMETK